MWLNLWRARGGQEGIEKSERKLLCVFFLILILIIEKRRARVSSVDIWEHTCTIHVCKHTYNHTRIYERTHTHALINIEIHTLTHILGEYHLNHIRIIVNFEKRKLIGRSHESGTEVPLCFISCNKGPFSVTDYECQCDIANFEVVNRYFVTSFTIFNNTKIFHVAMMTSCVLSKVDHFYHMGRVS